MATILEHVNFHSVKHVKIHSHYIFCRDGFHEQWCSILDHRDWLHLFCHSGGDKISGASSSWEWEKEADHIEVESKEFGS